MEDNRLAAAAAKGDREAFATLVLRYRTYVYRLAYKIALHEEDALDITQNVFLRLLERIGTFDGTGNFRAWLGTITARLAIDFLRSRNRRPSTVEMESAPVPVSEDANPRELCDREMRKERITRVMAELSPQQRAVIALRLHEDLGPKEIGEHLGIPARQVRVQLVRAIARIREILQIDLDDGENDR
ncbi:MAG TPA: RNA polymerase sigma factor [bacterium]|nr:RNA polymerase sigma factor [bacterium]HQP98622.1 RNA polymerase sigma factor [bacterium]